jgi:hypothetical protein
LAVAFGDGLAFGVGVKLTQQAVRQGAPAAAAGLSGVIERLERVESRMRKIEQAPAVRPAAAPSLDQHVIESVAHALEARLNETVGQVERRLAEMEARTALELKGMDQRMGTVASGTEAGLDELRSSVSNVLEAVERRTAERVAALDEALGRFRTAMPENVRREVEARVALFESRLEERIRSAAEEASELARQSVESRLEDHVGPLKLHLGEQRSTLEEVQRRSMKSDRTVLELLSGMGRLCEEATRRMAPASAEAPEAGPVAVTTPSEEEEVLPIRLEEILPRIAEPERLPLFAQNKKPGRFWRKPLVSSLLVLGAGLAAALRLL